MPSNSVTTASNFKSSDFNCDSAGNLMTETSRLEKDVAAVERPALSSPVREVGRHSRKRKHLPVENCGSLKDLVGVAKNHRGVEIQLCPQVQNGDVGERHEGRSSEVPYSTLDKNAAENGLPRPAGCRSQCPSDPSMSPSMENGFAVAQDELDCETDKDETLHILPRKKRGRRKLERPTKYVEHKEDDSGDSLKNEGARGRLRGGVGWEISLRQRPMPRVTFQAGDPYYISKRTREELLAKWKMELAVPSHVLPQSAEETKRKKANCLEQSHQLLASTTRRDDPESKARAP